MGIVDFTKLVPDIPSTDHAFTAGHGAGDRLENLHHCKQGENP